MKRSASYFTLAGIGMGCIIFLGCKTKNSAETMGTATAASTAVDVAPITPGTLSERFMTCPVANTAQSNTAIFKGNRYTYKSSSEIDYAHKDWDARASADWNALNDLVEDGVSAVVIDMRRTNGSPSYLYLGSNSQHHKIHETWSSSKFIGAVAAISRARLDSNGAVGADSSVGGHHIGDLISRMHNYYGTFGNVTSSSNSLGAYFSQLAGASDTDPRGYGNWLFGDAWLRINDGTYMNASGFGEQPFTPNSNKWIANGTNASQAMTVGLGNNNKEMSPLAMAEILKRVSQHETDPKTRVPGFKTLDAEILFYGNPARAGQVGGMSSGVSQYVVQGLTGKSDPKEIKNTLDSMAGPRWRVHHKIGWGSSSNPNRGCSSNRQCGEVVYVGYGCLPQYNGGHEFVIATYASYPGKSYDFASQKTNATIGKILGALKESWISGAR